jgi:hypothetical protein
MRARGLVLIMALVAWAPLAHTHGDAYPMAAEAYRIRVETRIARYRVRLDEAMREHATPPARQDAAHKALEAMIGQIRAAVTDVTKDGTVTQAEADRVKEIGKRMRDEIYRGLGIDRHKGE